MEGNDMPIVELPKHYSIDNERLGMAIAHVSAQANHLSDVHAALTVHQAEQETRQIQFVEERVAEARLEAEARTQALVSAINQAYGDPTALERRVDDRIQCVLASLQESSLAQARALAETQLATQNAVYKTLEEQIHEELLVVQERAALRAEESVQAAMTKMSSEHQYVLQQQAGAASECLEMHSRMDRLEKRLAQSADIAVNKAQEVASASFGARLAEELEHLDDRVVSRVQRKLLKTVNGLMENWQKESQQQYLKLQLQLEEDFDQRLDERLRDAIVVAKKAAEAEARGVVRVAIAKPSPTGANGSDISTDGTKPPKCFNLLAQARHQAQKEVAERAGNRAKELKSAVGLLPATTPILKRCLRPHTVNKRAKRGQTKTQLAKPLV